MSNLSIEYSYRRESWWICDKSGGQIALRMGPYKTREAATVDLSFSSPRQNRLERRIDELESSLKAVIGLALECCDEKYVKNTNFYELMSSFETVLDKTEDKE